MKKLRIIRRWEKIEEEELMKEYEEAKEIILKEKERKHLKNQGKEEVLQWNFS